MSDKLNISWHSLHATYMPICFTGYCYIPNKSSSWFSVYGDNIYYLWSLSGSSIHVMMHIPVFSQNWLILIFFSFDYFKLYGSIFYGPCMNCLVFAYLNFDWACVPALEASILGDVILSKIWEDYCKLFDLMLNNIII